MNQENINNAATALRDARANRVAIPRISETFGIAGAEQAYAVARCNTERDLAAGRRIVGKKIGLTSQAVQQQLGVDQPDYGVLFADMEFLAGSEVPASRLIQPKAEGEIAFVVGRDLSDENLSWGRFLHGLEYALPAIEIVDSAIQDWKLTLVDTVADNASCGLYVLGLEPKAIGNIDFSQAGMDFRKSGQTASVGSGVACLGNPLLAAYWLAKTMSQLGDPLKAGDVILSGALGPMFPFVAGDYLHLSIAGLGTVDCRTA